MNRHKLSSSSEMFNNLIKFNTAHVSCSYQHILVELVEVDEMTEFCTEELLQNSLGGDELPLKFLEK